MKSRRGFARGKPVNVPPTERKSPLLIAVEKGFHSLVELLLQNGAASHANGNALEMAVKRGTPVLPNC